MKEDGYLGEGLLQTDLCFVELSLVHLGHCEAVQQGRRGAVLVDQLLVDVSRVLRFTLYKPQWQGKEGRKKERQTDNRSDKLFRLLKVVLI